MKIKSLLLFLLLPLIISSSVQNTFRVNVYKSNGVAILEWQADGTENIETYSIYINNGDSLDFPSTKVAEVSNTKNNWVSSKRETFPLFRILFGIDIKDPSQWKDNAVLTPGEIYTIGVEKKLIDNSIERSDKLTIIPCENEMLTPSDMDSLTLNSLNLHQVSELRNAIFSSRFVELIDDDLFLLIMGIAIR